MTAALDTIVGTLFAQRTFGAWRAALLLTAPPKTKATGRTAANMYGFFMVSPISKPGSRAIGADRTSHSDRAKLTFVID